MALFLIFLNFLWWNLPKFSQHITHIQRDTNLKHEKSRVCTGSFFDFCKFISFACCEKTGLIDFPEKRALTKVKYLPLVCQILRIFTKGNSRKFTISFAFCTHVDVIKYWKTLTFSFERAQITWAFILSMHVFLKH